MIPTLQLGQFGRSQQDIAAGGSDPYFANVVLLMHGDGANGQTTTVDSSSYARAITAAGTVLPTLSTTQKKFGATSMAFTGANNSAFTAAASADFGFGTGDFTIEFWIYLASLSTAPYPISNTSASGGQGWYVNFGTGGDVIWGWSGTANGTISFATAGTIVTTTWQHVAFSRTAGALACFVAGVQKGSTAAHSINYTTSTRALSVGRDNTSGNNVNGYIDDVRITKGVGRYSANFSPPTAAFPDA